MITPQDLSSQFIPSTIDASTQNNGSVVTYPQVVSTGPAPDGPTSVINLTIAEFQVSFSEAVVTNTVDLSDFQLFTTGTIAEAKLLRISPINPTNDTEATTFTATVNIGFGDGSLRLDVVDNNSILSAANQHPLAGDADGAFQMGEAIATESFFKDGLPAPAPTPIVFGPVQTLIQGTQDNDNLLKGLGTNDRIVGKGGDDRLVGQGGDDLLIGGLGNDRLQGKIGNDILNGGGGDNRLNGNGGDDRLKGGNGNDILKGGNGNDVLTGRGGQDILVGGAGNDVFAYGSFFHGGDVIKDFSVTDDVLDFRKLFQNTKFSQLPDMPLNKFFRLEQVGSDTHVSIDRDGKRAGTVFWVMAILTNTQSSTLSSQNFVITD